MLTFLFTGTILGLSAGLAPGPLLALVISETLRHDIRSGIKVALAPLLTDLPIIAVTLFSLIKLARFQPALGVISVIGACFILYLGVQNLKTTGVHLESGASTLKSLQKGILVNLLSPHPYLFWITVGGPVFIRAMKQSLPNALAFVVGFYIFLVGSKILLALAAGRSRALLQGGRYVFVMRLLGFILILLAGFLLRDGLHLLGVL